MPEHAIHLIVPLVSSAGSRCQVPTSSIASVRCQLANNFTAAVPRAAPPQRAAERGSYERIGRQGRSLGEMVH
jgi:hypothetical protein